MYRIVLISLLIPSEGWGLLFSVGDAHAVPAAVTPTSMLTGGVDSPMAQVLQNALPPELANHLNSMGTLGPDGQPNGMLTDVDSRLLVGLPASGPV